MINVLAKSGGVIAAGLIVYLVWQYWPVTPEDWTNDEKSVLRSLWLESLPDLRPDPSNAVADTPEAALFGAQLFTDTRLSANGAVSCATCHQPDRHFTDGLPKGRGIGTSGRNTPSIVGSAYSPWLYWDGRRDSQWSQALAPLEDPNEHGFERSKVVQLIEEDDVYRATYSALFGPLPGTPVTDDRSINTVFVNIGKSIAAFERTIMPTPFAL